MSATRIWSYVTDIEGNVNYWEKFIGISKVLHRENGKLKLRENGGFIFGGDTVDKGNGDIRVVRDLLQLQSDYPDRVHLIMGNRDANKLRFSSELESQAHLSIPYWTPPEKRVSYESYLEKHKLTDSKPSRLKWMLAETMGANTTFETRRDELGILNLPNDDDAVVSSFTESVSTSGDNNFMLRYLQVAKLMVRLGNTLIVHGGVNDRNIGTVPGDSDIRESVDDWERDLNKWAVKQVEEFIAQPTWKELPDSETGRGVRGGDGLMDYGVPGGNGGATVVYSNYLDNGNADDVQEKTAEYLQKNSIHRVIVGHQPHGDCPTVINNNSVMQVVTADTSYSDMKEPDNRGCAVSELLLNTEDQTIQVHGILKTGKVICYSLACPTKEASSADDLLGKKLEDDWWVKSKLEEVPKDGKQYLVCKGEGYKLETNFLSAEEVKEKLKQ